MKSPALPWWLVLYASSNYKIKNMNHIHKYNHLFFTEESKHNAANRDFWQLLDDFNRANPQAELQVFHCIRKDAFMGRYVEFLEFQCRREQENNQVQTIYNTHYHIVPLTFQPFLEREPSFEQILLR